MLSFDLIGYGLSEKPQNFSYALEDQMNIIQQLLEQLHFSKIHIVAHSMGGIIGILLAEKLSRHMGTLINIEGSLTAEEPSLMRRRTISVPYEEFQNTVFQELRANFRIAEDRGSQLWAQWSEKADPLAFYRSAQSVDQFLIGDRLLHKFQALPCKKFYIYGEKNYERKKTLIEQMKNIPTISIQQSHHFVMNDNVQDFYTQLAHILI